MFDSLTTLMCVIITFISFLVHFYSNQYMSIDPHLPRFMSYLSLFTFFMGRTSIFLLFLLFI
jgi:NADH:ubiquinone oxidoreductase subunit 5 (subunit L)/multisubunit Na+/H+ antiporter MnhA subunit